MSRVDVRPYIREVSLKREKISSYDAYPFCIPAVRELDGLEFNADVTFVVGENGCGKSTLLEGIASAWGFNPEGGTANFRFSTRASHSSLYQFLRLVKSTRRPRDGFFLRAESFFNVATAIEELDKGPWRAAHHWLLRWPLTARAVTWRIVPSVDAQPIRRKRALYS